MPVENVRTQSVYFKESGAEDMVAQPHLHHPATGLRLGPDGETAPRIPNNIIDLLGSIAITMLYLPPWTCPVAAQRQALTHWSPVKLNPVDDFSVLSPVDRGQIQVFILH